jgi:hypothetical protein
MSWKDHPIVIAAGTCVATLGVCYKLLIPVYTTTLENQLAKDLNTISQLKEAANKAQARADRLNLVNKELLTDRAFSSCNPYPRAFSNIKVGDQSDRVFEVYGKEIVSREEDNRWLSVKPDDDPIFSDITYYFDTETLKISQLLFFFKERIDAPPLDSTHNPKTESATQLSIMKQIRNAFPQINIERIKEKSKPSYTASLNGKIIYHIEQNTLLITSNAPTIDNKACGNKK